MIDQITVFLENSKGRLAAMCRCVSDAGVNMKALSIADTTDFGIVRIIADEPARAVEALTAGGYSAALTQVTAIGVPNSAGGLADLLDIMDAQDVNVEYGYCFSLREDMAVNVLKIRGAMDEGALATVITDGGFSLLTNADIA